MVPALCQKVKMELAAASQSAAATRSANIDTLGADFATVIISATEANTSAATCAIVLKESDDTTPTNFATWSSSCSRAEDLTTSHQVVFHVDTRARKRYLRLEITNGSHTTNDLVTSAAFSLLSRRENVPAGTTGLVGSTDDVVVVL